MSEKCVHICTISGFSSESVKQVIRSAKKLKETNAEQRIMAHVPVSVSNDEISDLSEIFDMVLVCNEKLKSDFLKGTEEEKVEPIWNTSDYHCDWKRVEIPNFEQFYQKFQTSTILSLSVDCVNIISKENAANHIGNALVEPNCVTTSPKINTAAQLTDVNGKCCMEVKANISSPFVEDWIAVVGIAYRFPEASSLKKYGDVLITEQKSSHVPPADVHPTLKTNFLKYSNDEFDCGFFGLRPSEAASINLQGKLLMEVTWEAFEDAGINPEELKGSKTQIFHGSMSSDYRDSTATSQRNLENGFEITAEKLSSIYGFNTAHIPTEWTCSSSLVVLDLAVKSLGRMECPVAVLTGSNLVLPDIIKQNVVNDERFANIFDCHTDGCAGSEGVAVLILKRYLDAVRDNDNIHAIVRGTASGQEDGNKGLKGSLDERKAKVKQEIFAAANVDPNQVDYVGCFEKMGTITHVIIQEPPKIHKVLSGKHISKQNILTLSAKSETALNQLTHSFLSYLATTTASIEDIVFSANACRPHHPLRRVIIGGDKNEMLTKIETQQFISADIRGVDTFSPSQRSSICFTFPGISVKDIRDFRSLYHTTSYLKEIMNHCDSLYQKVTGRETLLTFLHPTSAFPKDKREEWYTLFTLSQYCIAKLWMHWGVQPAAVMGHSLGEVAATLVCGAMDLEEYLRLSLSIAGHMLQSSVDVPACLMAVHADRNEVDLLVQEFFCKHNQATHSTRGFWIDVACENSATQTVVVSPPRTMNVFKAFCQKQKIQCKIFHLDFCAHSRAVEVACQRSREEFNKITHRPMTLPYISSCTGEIVTEGGLSGHHWYHVFRDRVDYRKACKTVKEKCSASAFIEIGFSAYLSKITQDNLNDPKCLCISTFPKSGILTSLAHMYAWGANVNWNNFHEKNTFYSEGGQRVRLPSYPLRRMPEGQGKDTLAR